jgi:hypothetical protein
LTGPARVMIRGMDTQQPSIESSGPLPDDIAILPGSAHFPIRQHDKYDYDGWEIRTYVSDRGHGDEFYQTATNGKTKIVAGWNPEHWLVEQWIREGIANHYGNQVRHTNK